MLQILNFIIDRINFLHCFYIVSAIPAFTHDGAEIASGEFDGDEIICPRHGARFCIRTGEVKSAPAYEDIASLAVKIEEGRIKVKDTRWD
jgi:Rieske Fe-S protein